MLRISRTGYMLRSKKLIVLVVLIVFLLFYFKNLNTSSNSLVLSDGVIDLEENEKLVQILKQSVKASPLLNEKAQFEKDIEKDLAKQKPGLGDNGQAVTLDGEAKEIGEKQLAIIALNEELSEHLSYNRTTPDTRHPECKKKQYDLSEMGTTSVIIIFYNEPYSVLVRTVHSVLNTSPPELLKEIILVDDCSTNTELKGKLEYYVETRLPKKVKLLRLKSRLGLIRARLAGARLAKGDVLIFLDAHCECVTHWLEPLLERIHEKHDAVLVPIIDVIEAKNFYYSTNGANHFQVGGFTWDGHFDWHNVPDREYQRLKLECKEKVPEICPTNSPTMAGGLFAMRRDYFWEIGSYDEQMDGWGGENLEMSFRIWMCGGTLETIPCSRIGHIFRDFHPYSFPNDRDTHGINTVRMALVWMDDYIDYFFMNRPDLQKNKEIGDVTHRKLLREKLKCKSFEWYMKNVYPEKFVPTKNVRAYGRVTSKSEQNICLDDLSQGSDDSFNLGVYTCYRPEITNSQLFSLTNDGVFRTERSCATVPDWQNHGKKHVLMVPCHSTDEIDDRFEITADKQIRHVNSGLCLDHLEAHVQEFVYVTTCKNHTPEQKWAFEH